MDFTALEDFFSEDLGSHYVKGLSYSAGPNDTKLRELIPKWVKEKKVELGRPPTATIKGA